jgi:CheY-like chemotaxis protein
VRILIVEDERGVRDVFREFAAALRHEPVAVESAERALEQLEREPPDAILLDVRLPGMSGLAFLAHPMVRAAGVPVVVVSGATSEDEARQCLQLGALDYLRKPVTLERLAGVLELLEPYARSREAGPGARRRAARRAPMKLAVSVVSERGTTWKGTCTEISAAGMKLQTNAHLKAGGGLRVAFTPPDGGPPIEAVALVSRVDDEGAALWFVDLTSPETERLVALVDRLSPG